MYTSMNERQRKGCPGHVKGLLNGDAFTARWHSDTPWLRWKLFNDATQVLQRVHLRVKTLGELLTVQPFRFTSRPPNFLAFLGQPIWHRITFSHVFFFFFLSTDRSPSRVLYHRLSTKKQPLLRKKKSMRYWIRWTHKKNRSLSNISVTL